jgi:hypothetical protein
MPIEVSDPTPHDEIDADFVCPITYEWLDNAVILSSTITYSLANIQEWVKTKQASGQQVFCPKTHTPLDEDEVARILAGHVGLKNIQAQNMVETRIKERKAADRLTAETLVADRLAAEQRAVDRPKKKPRTTEVAPAELEDCSRASLSELARIFTQLDAVRDIVESTLENCSVPQVVALGMQSDGKSSVLERLVMRPIFPRNENQSTKMPVHVRLRWAESSQAPTLEVQSRTQDPNNKIVWTTDPGSTILVAEEGEDAVREKMEELMRGVQTVGGANLTNQKRIIVTVRARDVPNIDLIDLPGISSEPKDNVVVEEALEDQVKHNPHSIYLAVLHAQTKPNASTVMSWIKEKNLLQSTLGVFTHTDKVRDSEDRMKLCARINATTDEQAKACQGLLLPNYGWIAVSNLYTAGEVPAPVSRNPNFQRLQRQGIVERQLFAGNREWRSLYSSSKAGMKALVKKLERVYKDNLVLNWVPHTLKQLNHASRLESLRFNMLGMPSATQVASKPLPGNWMSVIQTRAETVVLTAVKDGMEELCETVMKEALKHFDGAEAKQLLEELLLPVELRGVNAHAEWCAKTVDAWQKSVKTGLAGPWSPAYNINSLRDRAVGGFLKRRLYNLQPLPSTHYKANENSTTDVNGSVFVAAGLHPLRSLYTSGTLEVRHGLSPNKYTFQRRGQTYKDGIRLDFTKIDGDGDCVVSLEHDYVHNSRTRVQVLRVSEETLEECMQHPPFQLCRFPAYTGKIYDIIDSVVSEGVQGLETELNSIVSQYFSPQSTWVTRTWALDESRKTKVTVKADSSRLVNSLLTATANRLAWLADNVGNRIRGQAALVTDWTEGCRGERQEIVSRIESITKATEMVKSIRGSGNAGGTVASDLVNFDVEKLQLHLESAYQQNDTK